MFVWECDYCAELLKDDDRALLALKRLTHLESGCQYMTNLDRARELVRWAGSWPV